MIIECNNKTSIDKSQGSSGDWVSTFNEPITINTGTQIIIKQVFVDNSSNNSQNITLEKDYDVSMEFGYYVEDFTHDGKIYYENEASITKTKATGRTYIARESDMDYIKGTKTFTVEKGIYSPNQLAVYINKKMTEIRPSGYTQVVKLVDATPFLINSGVGGGEMRFYQEDNDTNSDPKRWFKYQAHNHLTGCSQPSILWNVNDNGKFIFNYHTPFTYDGSPSVFWFRITDDKYMFITRMSGIFFTKLDSDNLFEDILQIDTSKMLFTFDTNKKISHNLVVELGTRTTGAFLSLVSAIKSKSGKGSLATDYEDDENYSLVSATDNFSIEADRPYIPNNNFGYFLISVSSFMNDFRTAMEIDNSIMGVLSAQNQINNFITGYGGEMSVVWVNRGEPFLLSEVRCQILDHNKNTLSYLGQYNTIFLEVIEGEKQKNKK